MPVKAESEALASYWLQQIEAWQSSGQTQQAYLPLFTTSVVKLLTGLQKVGVSEARKKAC